LCERGGGVSKAPTQYLPILVRDGGVTDWERGFCASLIARTRKGLRLTDKQVATLQRIVDAFQARSMGGDVIE